MKCILLEDEDSDLLQLWKAATPLDIKGNRVIKKEFVFLANHLVFSNMVSNVKTVAISSPDSNVMLDDIIFINFVI